MKLADAEKLATRIVVEIEPFCERVAIAGSIRRRKPEVKDIEIVAIPRVETRPDLTTLFQDPLTINLLHEWALSACVLWIKPGVDQIISWNVHADGKYWRGLLPANIKLDLFIASPINWGIIFAIRTGSAEFSQALVSRARELGAPCVDGHLTKNGRPLETFEEEDVFRLLQLDFIPPETRNDKTDWLFKNKRNGERE